MDEIIQKLWENANNHCFTMLGEWIDGTFGDTMPAAPEDNAELVKLVAEYLAETI